MAGEVYLIGLLCGMLGGSAEYRVDFDAAGRDHWIFVDCMTDTYVIEVGLDDRRSSYDSLHQAIYATVQTGRTPMLAIIDTNGVEENEEYQIATVADYLGICYRVYREADLHRWFFVRRSLDAQAATDRYAVDYHKLLDLPEQKGGSVVGPLPNDKLISFDPPAPVTERNCAPSFTSGLPVGDDQLSLPQDKDTLLDDVPQTVSADD